MKCAFMGCLDKMVSEISIYRTANEFIKQYGEDAAIFVAMRSDELLAQGDIDGQRVWIKIMKAVDELQSTDLPEGAIIH